MVDVPRTRADDHPELPLDSDVERQRSSDRYPPFRQPLLIGLVFAGGSLGTFGRWAVGVAVPHVLRVPLGTVVVNVVGAFVLGALLEHLAGRGPDQGRRRMLRVTFGTGFCGGFTTYSAFATDADTLVRTGLVGHAVGYVGATLALGLVASALGIVVGRRRSRVRPA